MFEILTQVSDMFDFLLTFCAGAPGIDVLRNGSNFHTKDNGTTTAKQLILHFCANLLNLSAIGIWPLVICFDCYLLRSMHKIYFLE